MKKTILFVTIFLLIGLGTAYAITQAQFINLNLDNVQTKGKYLGTSIESDAVLFRYQYQMLDENLEIYNKTGYYSVSKKELIQCITDKGLINCKNEYKEKTKTKFWTDFNSDINQLKVKQEQMINDLTSFDITINDNELEK